MSKLEQFTIFQCYEQRACEITSETRRKCPACRLAKCFQNGMRRDRLSTMEQKAEKRHQIEENRNLTINSNSKRNEQQQQAQLSSAPITSPFVSLDDLPTTLDPAILSIPDLVDLLSPTVPKSQQSLLSPEDVQRVANISLLFKKWIDHASNEKLTGDPSMHLTNFLQTLNRRSVTVMQVLSFYKEIPEFNELNVDDKVTLIKYNLPIVLPIIDVIAFVTGTHGSTEPDNDLLRVIQFGQMLYGYHTFQRVKQIFGSFSNIVKLDQSMIHLTLIIIILTSGFSTTDDYDSGVRDTMAVYRAQTSYTELLWKYMETVLGLEKSIQVFSQLVIHTISWQTIQEELRSTTLRILSPTDMNELLPIIKSVYRIP